VRRLAERLRASGLRAWFDEWIIKPGDDIYLKIEHGLEYSRSLVLCMSRAAFASEWIKLERSASLFRDPANQQRRFIPLRLEDCQVPDALRRLKYVDWLSENEDIPASLLEACRPPDQGVRDSARAKPKAACSNVTWRNVKSRANRPC
jgi:hypothetical protein